jgi:hypothetical protein
MALTTSQADPDMAAPLGTEALSQALLLVSLARLEARARVPLGLPQAVKTGAQGRRRATVSLLTHRSTWLSMGPPSLIPLVTKLSLAPGGQGSESEYPLRPGLYVTAACQ